MEDDYADDEYDQGRADGFREGYDAGEKTGAQRVMDTQVVMLRHKLAKLVVAAEDFVNMIEGDESTDIFTRALVKAIAEAKAS